MSARHLSAYGLRRALIAGIRRVVEQREEINRINVFPVADRDTGTNLAFTLGAVLQGVREPRFVSAGEILRRVAEGALDGARGNSGAIMAQFFQGLAEGPEPGRLLTAGALAQAAARGSARARTAMADPLEGTMLSAIQAFADGLQARAGAGEQDIRACFRCALERAREALRRTRDQIRALHSAGVVDAGALGFVDLLEGIAEYIERGRGGLDDGLPEESPDGRHRRPPGKPG